ncbi:MAG: hypothetical protein J5959_01415 [Butyrivibrio sp.]|nr:hypothetical protein [Butyrivibrio sp.]
MKTSNYPYIEGHKFNRKKITDQNEYLQIAEGVHAYLESIKVTTPDGIYWAVPGNDKGNGTIYTGSAGVAYFYGELYKITKNPVYLDIIAKAADYLNKNWKNTISYAVSLMESYGIYDDTGIEYSYYTGVCGVGEGLIAIYAVTGRNKEKESIADIASFVASRAKSDDAGPYWGSDCSMLFDGGTMLFLYHAAELLEDGELKELADKVADRIVSKAERDPRGGYAWESTAHKGTHRIPNFECGTAGIGYALTIAYSNTAKKEYLNAAVEAAKHIKAIAVPQGKGFLIPWHDNPGEEPIFYVANCHGPSGTSKLFYRLYELTGKDSYLEDIKSLYYGLRHINAPEQMSPGCWNTVCVCCGTAGILQFLINLGIIFDGSAFATEVSQEAVTAAEILSGEQESKTGGRIGVWPVAYERVRPENVAPDFGHGTGSAGIGATLLQMYLFEQHKAGWYRFIDDPYPTWLNE